MKNSSGIIENIEAHKVDINIKKKYFFELYRHLLAPEQLPVIFQSCSHQSNLYKMSYMKIDNHGICVISPKTR